MERFGNSAGDTEITVTKTLEQALKECEEQFNRAMSDKNPSATYWVDIGYNDENDFAVVMCYMDEDSAESYGYDGESDFVQAKFAYCPRNSMMNEYEWDWLMPYPVNEYDDTLDTDMSIYSADSSDFGWILDEGYKFIDEFNANLPADEDDWDDFDDEDSDLYEAKETDGTVKFYYKGNLVGTCDTDYIDCDAVYELMKKDKTASTAVLNYMNSLGDPVFPVSDEDWSTAETNVDNVDIEDLYYWFMKELGYEADEYDEGLYTEFDGWEIFADEDSDLYEGCGSKKKKKKVLNQKKVCGEDRMYDLTPQKRDSRKSFYGKAKVVDKGNGEYELISYNTPVACVKDGKVVYADLRKWSATTDRHIREFLAQFCDECDL